jgi:hypothetical protein
MQKSTAVSGRHAGYGIGWAVSEPPDGYRLVSHSGGMGGVSTTLRLVPSEKLAVIVLCNSGSGVPHRISDEILTAMLPRWRAGGSDGGPRPGRFEPPKELLGSWKGTFANYKAELPMTLRVFESGDIHAQIGGQMKMLWNGVRWQDGYLSGRMPGDAGTEDAGRRPHYLSFTLKLRGSVLNGAASALSQPGRRAGNALTQWVELKKE